MATATATVAMAVTAPCPSATENSPQPSPRWRRERELQNRLLPVDAERVALRLRLRSEAKEEREHSIAEPLGEPRGGLGVALALRVFGDRVDAGAAEALEELERGGHVAHVPQALREHHRVFHRQRGPLAGAG